MKSSFSLQKRLDNFGAKRVRIGIGRIFLAGLLLPPLAFAEPKQDQGDAVATVSGQTIYAQEVDSLIENQIRQLHGQIRQLQMQEFELKKQALDRLIRQRVVESTAKQHGLSAKELLHDVTSKVQEPSEAEVRGFYLAVANRLGEPFAEAKAKVKESLYNILRQQAVQDYIDQLRADMDVVVLLQPPRFDIQVDPSRVLGSPEAPVTIVEFSDFQCPYCKEADGTLREVLRTNSGNVRLAYRDYPIDQLHPLAKGAAEASRCAGAQGKFWQYHDVLFAHQDKLTRADLLEHAGEVHLDKDEFQKCLDSGKYRKDVEKDVATATELGLTGTPAFFVNGVLLNGVQPAEAFQRAIDDALASLKNPRTEQSPENEKQQ